MFFSDSSCHILASSRCGSGRQASEKAQTVCFCVHLCTRRLVSRWNRALEHVSHRVCWDARHSVVIPECYQTCLSGFHVRNMCVWGLKSSNITFPVCFYSPCSIISPVNRLNLRFFTDKTSRRSEDDETTPQGWILCRFLTDWCYFVSLTTSWPWAVILKTNLSPKLAQSRHFGCIIYVPCWPRGVTKGRTLDMQHQLTT